MSNESEDKVFAEEIPVVRIEMDFLKRSIMRMLDPAKINPFIEEKLNRAIERFDFEGQVKTATEICIDKHVRNYFEYGEGSRIIGLAVREALTESLKNLMKKIKKNK